MAEAEGSSEQDDVSFLRTVSLQRSLDDTGSIGYTAEELITNITDITCCFAFDL